MVELGLELIRPIEISQYYSSAIVHIIRN